MSPPIREIGKECRARRQGTRITHRRGTRFELIPMIDVFMIITLFLMVMAFLPQISESLRAELPSSKTAEKTAPSVLVQLSKAGELYLQGQVLVPAVMKSRMKAMVGEKPDLAVVIAADKTIAFEKVVNLIDLLKLAGVKRLGLATERPRDDARLLTH